MNIYPRRGKPLCLPSRLGFFLFILTWPIMVAALDWRGSLGLEGRVFEHQPTDPEQQGNGLSLALEQAWSHEWDEGRQGVVFAPFIRIDPQDDQRSHGDIRELNWLYAADSYEWRLGIRKVFWGVAESQHLVDIINQTDLIEDIDTEDKLGQPMINLALIQDWGTVDLFALPYFRERSFPGRAGRLRAQPRVLGNRAVYASDRKQRHIDYAIRWSHTVDVWDIGISYFNGTSRDPRLLPAVIAGETVLIPHYDQIRQAGLDLQATIDTWLWKLEAISRTGNHGQYFASTAGLEYSFYGIWDTTADLGLVVEHLYDSRNTQATSPFQNDLMLGFRVALNDEQSSEALIGIIRDVETAASLFSIEASRRIGDSYTLDMTARKFVHPNPKDLLYSFRNDDYLQVDVKYHY